MRVRIINDDGISRNTKVLNAETGEEIENVLAITIDQLTALGGPMLMTIELEPLSLDITGVASFVKVCPYCGETIRQEREGEIHDTTTVTTVTTVTTAENPDGPANPVE